VLVGLGAATPVIIPKLNANETIGARWNAQGSARPIQGRSAALLRATSRLSFLRQLFDCKLRSEINGCWLYWTVGTGCGRRIADVGDSNSLLDRVQRFDRRVVILVLLNDRPIGALGLLPTGRPNERRLVHFPGYLRFPFLLLSMTIQPRIPHGHSNSTELLFI
jgi:hypothetical protein